MGAHIFFVGCDGSWSAALFVFDTSRSFLKDEMKSLTALNNSVTFVNELLNVESLLSNNQTLIKVKIWINYTYEAES